jgi:hypothetical protein
LGALAQQIEPVRKMMMAVRKTVRAPKRSAMRPDTGMKTARLRGRQHGAVQLLHEHGGADDQGNGTKVGLWSTGFGHDPSRLGPVRAGRKSSVSLAFGPFRPGPSGLSLTLRALA